MKITSSMKFIVAMSLAAIAATSARASNVPQYHNGDLLLGFYDTTGASTNDYIVDLGSVSNFNFNTNFTLTLGLAADLTTAFGSAWNTSGNIDYGFAVGFPTTGQAFVSNPNLGSPWPEAAAQGSITQTVASIGNAYSNQTQTHSETNASGFIQGITASNSWASQTPGLGSNFFGSGGDGGISDVTTNPLEFDRVNQVSNGTAADLGTFSLNSAGNVNFVTAAAVPEPSTFAALGLGAAALAFIRRRRRA